MVNANDKAVTVIEQRTVMDDVQINIYGTFENPLFLAQDVALGIGYDLRKVNELVAMVDGDEKLTTTIPWSGQRRRMWFLTEAGLYEVLFQSRMPLAQRFKQQVKAILKEIRMTGGYNMPKTMPEALRLLADRIEHSAMLERYIDENKDYTTLGRAVSQSTKSIAIDAYAKALSTPQVYIGPVMLFKFLHQKGYLRKGRGSKDPIHNAPSAYAMQRKWFERVEKSRDIGDGKLVYFQTLITPKGQAELAPVILDWFTPAKIGAAQ